MIGQTDPDSGLLSWVLGACGAIGSLLVGAIVFLFRLIMTQAVKQHEGTLEAHTRDINELRSKNEVLEKRSTDCENERGELRVIQAELRGKQTILEGRIATLEKEKGGSGL